MGTVSSKAMAGILAQSAGANLEPLTASRALDRDFVRARIHPVGKEALLPHLRQDLGPQERGVAPGGPRRAYQHAVLRLCLEVPAEPLRVGVVATVEELRRALLLAAELKEDRVAAHIEHAALD